MKPEPSTPSGSAFADWFKDQYGKLPSSRRRMALSRKHQELKAAYDAALLEYRAEDALHAAYNNALYGWNARKK